MGFRMTWYDARGLHSYLDTREPNDFHVTQPSGKSSDKMANIAQYNSAVSYYYLGTCFVKQWDHDVWRILWTQQRK